MPGKKNLDLYVSPDVARPGSAKRQGTESSANLDAAAGRATVSAAELTRRRPGHDL